MDDNTTPLCQCTKCKNWFPLTTEYFPPRKVKKNGFDSWCRKCRNKKTAQWFKDNPDKAREYAREQYSRNPDPIRARAKKWYDDNTERSKEAAKRWRIEHPEEYAEYQRQYTADHAEKNRARAKEWSKANPERKKVTGKSYYERTKSANKSKRRDILKRWRKANPEQHRAQLSKRRARKMNAEGQYNAQDIRDLYEEQQGLCAYCGIRLFDEYHIDHVVPLVRGGSNWPDNLMLACPECNSSKNDKLLPEWESTRGW